MSVQLKALLVVVLLSGVAMMLCAADTDRYAQQHIQKLSGKKAQAQAVFHQRMMAQGSLPVFNVMDYGAVADGKTDNTGAFQKALDAAAATDGGEVFAPEGNYLFTGSLSVGNGVALRGSFASVPAHDTGAPPADGSVLMPTAFRGNEGGTPFITLNRDATLAGFVVYYPDQVKNQVPQPYPYSVSMVGDNSAVTDVELLNSFNGISAVLAGRHYIARVQGQPTNIGVFVDQTYDIGRIEDVHFNPWYSQDKTYLSWQMINGRAFVLGRSDWEYIWNTFAFGYAIGYHFIETSTGEMNGNFLGLGADYATNASVLVDASQAPGLLFTNGEFTSFHDAGFAPNSTAISTQIVVSASNSGPVQFVNTAFWGPSDHIADLRGSGTTTFSSCTFVQWDLMRKDGEAAIQSYNGNLVVTGSNFQMKGKQVELFQGTKKAIIVGNIMEGGENIVNHGIVDVQKGFNV